MRRIMIMMFASLSTLCNAQPATNDKATPIAFTADEDHQNMMDQLGVKALRPGPSGNESAPNHANYDESLANPYPDLPDPLVLNNGKKVTTADMWWKQRRPEIVEDFEREVYGRLPKNIPKVTWKVVLSERENLGFTPVLTRKVIGHVDNSMYAQIDVNISMIVVTPANAKGPVPVLMMFGTSTFPAAVQPNKDDFEKLNAAFRELMSKDPEIKALLDKYPTYSPLVRPAGVTASGFQMPQPGEPSPTNQLIADGWGFVLIEPGSIQADNGEGITKGIIGLVNKGQPRKPDDWGALRAWSWGAARALDYLETDATVDSKHIGIEGVSRYGKAALVTLAFEPRFAFGLIGSSGKGGSTLHRRNFGEAVESLTGGEYYWMAGNYIKYGASEGKYGNMDAGKLPVDSHELIALCAPRPTFISYGVPEQGDAKWLDQQGSYMATVAAGPVYRLLGAKDIGVSSDYKTEKMPGVNISLLDGELAWRQHDGGHTDAPNFKYFIPWADKFVRVPSKTEN
ncbi:MAG: acetylxylan esterase [Chryseolinea sp.]